MVGPRFEHRRVRRDVAAVLVSAALLTGGLTGWPAPPAQAYERATSSGANSVTYPSGLTVTSSTISAETAVDPVVTPGATTFGDPAFGYNSGDYTPDPGQGTPGFRVDVPAADECGTYGECALGRGSIVFTFSQPVRNPRLHLDEIGGVVSNGDTTNAASTLLELTSPSGVNLTAAAGSRNLRIVAGDTIETPDRTARNDCSLTGAKPPGCGTVVINGTVRQVVFDLSSYLALFAGPNNPAPAADSFALSFTVDQDFGDAPSSYAGGNAARAVLSDLTIGESVTADNTGVANGTVSPNAGATADGDDDDGLPIQLPVIRAQGGLTISRTIPISGASKAGTACGWIDFNRNGTFDSATERACTTFAAGAETATLQWTTPNTISAGASYARVRVGYNATQTQTPNGPSDSGEVEDARVDLVGQRLDCSTGTFYGLSNPAVAAKPVYSVNPTTGATTTGASITAPTNQSPNGMGISSDGRYLYSVAGGRIYETDIENSQTISVPTTFTGVSTHGSVSPQTGIYYYGNLTLVSGNYRLDVYGYNPTTDTSLGLVARGNVPGAPGPNGDLVFDTVGDLYVVAGGTSSNVFSVANQKLPATTQSTPLALTFSTLATIPANAAINSAAFGADGYLFLGSATTVYKVVAATGSVLSQVALTGVTGSNVDFGSCANPNVLAVRKNFAGHAVATDQFTTRISGNGVDVSATTTGTQNGLHDDQLEQAGPVPVLADQTFTIGEVGASGATTANYTTRYVCQNSKDNTVLARGTTTSGTVTMPSGTDAVVTCTFTNTPLAPAVSLSKAALPPTGNTAGSTLPYRFTVTNTGTVELTSIVVTDPKVGTVTCPNTTLPVGRSAQCSGRYTLTQADIDAGQVLNTATVTAQSNRGPVTDTASATALLDRNPSLFLTKTAGTPTDVNNSGLTDAGDTIAYTFRLTNTGNVGLTAVAVSDPKVGPVTCLATTLAPGAATTCTAPTYTITAADQTAGRVDNRATATGTAPAGAGTATSNQAATSTPVATPNPQLTLTKSVSTVNDVNASGITEAGDTITYAFSLRNNGNVPIRAITVTDAKLGPVTCQATALAVNATTTCTAATYTITAADQSAGVVQNTASAGGTAPSGANVASNTSSTSTPITTPNPVLVLTKTAGTPTDVNGDGFTNTGDTIAYTFTVRNAGNVPITAIAVADAKVGPVTCVATSLAAGASTTCSVPLYTVTAADTAAGRVDNSAAATGRAPGNVTVTSNTATTSTPTTAATPKLTLTKTAGAPVDVNNSGLVDAGDTIAYTFTIKNDGNLPITAVAINDAKVGAVTCAATSLAIGASTTCQTTTPYVVTTADQTAGSVVNNATATGTARGGATVTSNPATTNTRVATPNPQLSLVKTAGTPVDVNNSGNVDAPDTIAYSFAITNTGNVPIRNVGVSDAKVGTVTCPVTTLAPGATTTCTAAAYVITTADETAGRVLNSATARGTNPDGGTVTSAPSTTSTTVVAARPQLSVNKRAATPVDTNRSGIVDAGDTIAFTFVVTNTGNVPIRTVAVADAKAGTVTCPATTLAAGATTTCTAAPYVITTADQAAGTVDNSATVTGRNPNNGAVTSSPDTTSTPVATPDPKLSFDKIAAAPVDRNNSGLTDAGDTIAYTFTVTNLGNVPISAVRITDDKAGAVTCAATTLAPNATTTCTANALYVVTAADVAAGSVLNTARANGTDPNGAGVRSNEDTTTTATTPPAPKLQLVKTAARPVDVNSSGLTDAGDTIAYTFTVINTGNVPLRNVAVDDARAGAVTCQATTLAPGARTSCAANAPYVITTADEAAGLVKNTATATGTNPDGGGVRSEPASTTTAVDTPNPVLTLVKTAAAPVDVNRSGLTDAGDTIAYTFRVTNSGNVPVRTVAVNDPLVGTVTCTPTTLAPNAVASCTAAAYVIKSDDETAGQVTNLAVATGRDPNNAAVRSNNATTTTPVQTPKPQLSFTKTAGAPVDRNSSGITDAGDTIAFTFTVTNTGNVPVTGVGVTDPKAGTVTCTATTLAPQATTTCTSAPYVVTKADEATGSVTNTASATATDPDGDPVNSPSATTSTPVQKPNPQLVVDKTAGVPVDVNSSGITDAGDTIAFSFTVSNPGNVPVRLVVVRDSKAGPVTCSATTVNPGQTVTCSEDNPYVVTEADEAAGSVNNTAIVTGTDPDGGGVASPPDSTTTPVTTPKPSLLFDKQAAAPIDVNRDGLTDAGDTIAYTFTVTNTGNVPIRGVTVLDPKIGAVTCVPTTLGVGNVATCTPNTLYVVTRDDERAGQVANDARATGRDPDNQSLLSNPDSTATPVGSPSPTISVDKTAGTPTDVNNSGITDAGDTIQYSFVVTNTGNVPVNAIAVTDATAGPVTCDATTLAVGANTACRADNLYVITEADERAGLARNTATAGGVDNDGNIVTSDPDSTATPVTTPNPLLQLVKSAGTPVDVNSSGLTDAGDTIAYTFTVTNTGNVPIRALGVNDPTAGTVTCPVTTLAVNASTTCTAAPYVITAADETAGSVVNRATAAGSDPDNGPVTSPSSSTATPVDVPNPGLTLVKSAAAPVDVNADGITDAGDTIAYTFTVTNTGNVPVRAVAVSDPKLGSVTCTPTTLAVNAVANCTAAPYVITDADETAGSVINLANASGTDPDGDPVPANTATTTTPVATPAPSLLFDKTAAAPVDVNADGLTDAGDTIAFSFTVANTGNVPVTGVGVSDTLVGAVSCSPTTLAPNAVATCTAAPYVITEADEATGSVVNSATGNGRTNDGDPVSSNPDGTSTPVQTPNPVLSFKKTAGTPVDVNGSGITDAGDTIAYTFTVTNTGNVPISGVGVNDAKVGPVTCTPTTLAVGAVARCVSDNPYVVTEADERAGAVVNTANANGRTNDNDPVRSPNDSTSTEVTVPNPLLRLEKFADTPVDVNRDGLVDAGDTIQYRFTVRNVGNVPITAVAISDPLAGAVTCGATTLAVGQSTTCAADALYVIKATDLPGGTIENTATATGTDPDGGAVLSNPASSVVKVDTPLPDLRLLKSAAAPVDVNRSGLTDAGDTIAYTFTVTNDGNVPLNNLVINDPKIGAAPCTPTTLAPGAVAVCTPAAPYVVTGADEQAGFVINTATAGAATNDGDPVTSNPSTTTTPTTVPDPELSVDKTADDPVDVNASGLTDAGDTIQYRFRVSNTGNVPITAVAIDDPLAGAVTCQATTLAVGASTTCVANAVYTVTGGDEAAGIVENTATATGTDPDRATTRSRADSTRTPVSTPATRIVFDKVAGAPVDVNADGITDAGDTIAYTFTVANSGNVPVRNVAVSDPKVGTVTCTPTRLAPGDIATCTAAPYVITEADETAGQVANTATASAVDPDGDPVASNPDSTSTPVVAPAPALLFDKTAGAPVDVNNSGLTDAGDTITFTFTVTNTGNVPVSAVAVRDPKVGPVTCTPTRLAVNGVATCTAAAYVVTEADERAGAVTNTATASGTTNDGDPVASNPDSTSTPTTVPAPSLQLEKTADAPVDVNADGITDAGDTIQYRFTMTNTGNVPITTLVIDDDRVDGVTCRATRLEVGGSTTCVADAAYVITPADETAAQVVNTAAATGIDPDGDPVTSPPDSTSTPVVAPAPRLILDKIAAAPVDVNNSGLTDAGDTIAYTFTVTNAGNVPVNAITVTDSKIGAVTCDVTVLAPGAVANCSPVVGYVVTEADEQAGAVLNTATAAGTTNDGDPVQSNPDSTSTPTTAPNAALSLDKTAAAPIDVNNDNISDAGDTIAYSFVVTNVGNVPLTRIVVNDAKIGPVTCAATELAFGASTTCTTAPYVITDADEAAGAVTNTATAGGSEPDGGSVTSPPDGTVTPVVAPAPVLTLTKTASPPSDVNGSGITDAGDTIAYTFSITNTGNVPANAIVVNDPLVGAVTCAVTVLAPGASTACLADAPYVITSADVAAGTVVNIATATGVTVDGDPVTSNQARTNTPTTTPGPRLVLDKAAAAPVDVNRSGAADAGDTIAYTFTLTNSGNVPLTDLTVNDPLIGAVSCPVTRLAVGQSTTCSPDAPYVITEADLRGGGVTNTAMATGRDPDGNDVDSGTDSTTTPLAPVSTTLTLVKTNKLNDSDGDGKADAGETIAYSFAVTNTGNVTISGVTIGDSLLDAAGDTISCRDTTLAPGQATTCTGTYTVTATDVRADEIVNEATVAGCADPATTSRSARAALVDLADCQNVVRSNVAGTTTATDVPTGPPSPLPNTGGPSLGLAGLALALLVAGLALVAARRRRAN